MHTKSGITVGCFYSSIKSGDILHIPKLTVTNLFLSSKALQKELGPSKIQVCERAPAGCLPMSVTWYIPQQGWPSSSGFSGIRR